MGVRHARELADLCLHHDVYRWLCSGVPIHHRCLSAFRKKSGRLFDDLVTKVLALLMEHSPVELHRIAQDGTRIRASAGAASFRRGATLEELMTQARAHLEVVSREGRGPALGARRKAVRARAAQDRVTRIAATTDAARVIVGLDVTNAGSGHLGDVPAVVLAIQLDRQQPIDKYTRWISSVRLDSARTCTTARSTR